MRFVYQAMIVLMSIRHWDPTEVYFISSVFIAKWLDFIVCISEYVSNPDNFLNIHRNNKA